MVDAATMTIVFLHWAELKIAALSLSLSLAPPCHLKSILQTLLLASKEKIWIYKICLSMHYLYSLTRKLIPSENGQNLTRG